MINKLNDKISEIVEQLKIHFSGVLDFSLDSPHNEYGIYFLDVYQEKTDLIAVFTIKPVQGTDDVLVQANLLSIDPPESVPLANLYDHCSKILKEAGY